MANQRQKRAKRLRSARRWLARYSGEDLVRGYRKRYCAGRACAILELRMLGVDIPDAYLEQASGEERDGAAFRETDEGFAFVAGDTPGGAPYGTAREEIDEYWMVF